MNRHFIPNEGLRDYPRRSFARIDQVEPIHLENADEVVIGFDAVDADWIHFGQGQQLTLSPPELGELRDRMANYWRSAFEHKPPNWILFGLFDEAPLYHIELTLPKGHPWLADLLDGDAGWFKIDLADQGEREVDVFGGLFQAPVVAQMAHAPERAEPQDALNAIFDMDTWPDAAEGDVMQVLSAGGGIEQLVAFDVGQGSANALVDSNGYPQFYFDAGCGVYHNAKTSPAHIGFCTCQQPSVILSHWDSDHWAGATKARNLLSATWIAPRQSIGPRHAAFAASILAAGTLLILPPHMLPIGWGTTPACELRQCRGALSNRNETGVVLIVDDPNTTRSWLLTGDAAYHLIPGLMPPDFAAVVVPHHGADMGPKSTPPAPSTPYSRLIYSFGPGNRHGRTKVQHPTVAAVTAHVTAGWVHGWLPTSPGTTLAGHPVLATATHATSHDDGIVAGWTAPGIFPAHLTACSSAMPVSQH